MEPVELQFPVPWGTIAAKAWGDINNEVILAVHGVQDNAATFDRLIPMLPSSYYYICIDLPGHGKSSHLPNSLFIYNWDYLVAYKLVFDCINTKPVIVLGHSYGAQLAFYFSILYPDYVKKLIMLDSVHFKPIYAEDFKTFMLDRIEQCIKQQEKLANGRAPIYTYEDALNRLVNNRIYGVLNDETAEILLKRHLVPVNNNRFTFSLDQRLKFYVDPLHSEQYELEVFKKNPICCPMLIIFMSESKLALEFTESIQKELKKFPNCIMHHIVGSHTTHINSPEIVAPYLNKFLLNNKSKL